MITHNQQRSIILEFMNYIFSCEFKNGPIAMIKRGDGSIEHIPFNVRDGSCDDVMKKSKTSEYGVIYIPNKSSNNTKIFFNFMDPEDMLYTVWKLNNGSLSVEDPSALEEV